MFWPLIGAACIAAAATPAAAGQVHTRVAAAKNGAAHGHGHAYGHAQSHGHSQPASPRPGHAGAHGRGHSKTHGRSGSAGHGHESPPHRSHPRHGHATNRPSRTPPARAAHRPGRRGSPAAAPGHGEGGGAPGLARDRHATRSTLGRVVKAIAALVPLEELAGRAGRAGGGAPTAVEPRGTVRQAAVKRHRHPTAHRGSAGAADGPLPFTGLALLTLVLAGAALVSVGGPLRRATRARKRARAAALPARESEPPRPRPPRPRPGLARCPPWAARTRPAARSRGATRRCGW